MRTVGKSKPISSISRRLIIYIVLCSSIITLFLSLFQLYNDYRSDITILEEEFNEIENVYIKSISASLWSMDLFELETLIEGLVHFGDVNYVEVIDNDEILVTVGEKKNTATLSRSYPLTFESGGKKHEIGQLLVTVGLSDTYQRLLDRAILILISNAIKTTLVVMLMVLIFYREVIRHLTRIAEHLNRYDLHTAMPPLSLDRPPRKQLDEIDHVVNAFNELEANLMDSHKSLRHAHDQLERRVNERTEQLRGEVEERKRIEDNLVQANEVADAANRAKSDLMANMSHELRTPLNAIIGFSDSMKLETFGPLGNDKYREYLDDIHFSGQHLLELINDILDVSAIEAGALELQEEDVNVSNVVDASIRIIRPRADEGNVIVTSSIDAETPLLYVDERRTKQILLNLLSNAVKFTPSGGEVSVSSWINENGSLAMAVSDTGIGMNTDEIAQALSKFGQVDCGLDRKHEGSGLGLPLTKGLMELQGGTMEVKSKKDRGTMVMVTFPSKRVGKKT